MGVQGVGSDTGVSACLRVLQACACPRVHVRISGASNRPVRIPDLYRQRIHSCFCLQCTHTPTLACFIWDCVLLHPNGRSRSACASLMASILSALFVCPQWPRSGLFRGSSTLARGVNRGWMPLAFTCVYILVIFSAFRSRVKLLPALWQRRVGGGAYGTKVFCRGRAEPSCSGGARVAGGVVVSALVAAACSTHGRGLVLQKLSTKGDKDTFERLSLSKRTSNATQKGGRRQTCSCRCLWGSSFSPLFRSTCRVTVLTLFAARSSASSDDCAMAEAPGLRRRGPQRYPVQHTSSEPRRLHALAPPNTLAAQSSGAGWWRRRSPHDSGALSRPRYTPGQAWAHAQGRAAGENALRQDAPRATPRPRLAHAARSAAWTAGGVTLAGLVPFRTVLLHPSG